MDKFLLKLTLKQKIKFGFGVIWAVLAVITVQAVINLALVRYHVKQTVEIKQPIAVQAEHIAFTLEQAMKSLDFYVLTSNQKAFQEYEHNLTQSQADAIALKQRFKADLSAEDLATFARLNHLFASLPPLVEQLVRVRQKQSLQYPAFGFVNKNMLPQATIIQNQISMMLDSELAEASEERSGILKTILELQKTWLNVMSDLRGYIAFRTPEMANSTTDYLNHFEETLARLKDLGQKVDLTLEEEDALQVVMDAYETYRENFMEVRNIHEGPKWRIDSWMIANRIEPVFTKIETAISSIAHHAVVGMQDESQEVVDSSLRNLILLLVLSVIGQLVGMLISNKVVKSVVSPVASLAKAMKNIAQGDGDLTSRLAVKGRDELTEMAKDFNLFIQKIQNTLQDVTLTVEELEGASTHLLGVTQDAKEGIQTQLKVVEALDTSMVEMANQAGQVDAHSQNTTKANQQAVEMVEEGGAVVTVAAEHIQSISQSMEEITQAVMQLNDDSQTISVVTTAIREIAEQTNLLALNAAIEAARAGENGRGFAVVADEVRELAQRTQDSTLKIEEVIEKIKEATLHTVSVVESGQAITQEGYDSVMKAHQVLQPVVTLMGDISAMSHQMMTASHTQTNLVKQVNQRINEIHDVSAETVQGTEKTEESGHYLQSLADKLEKLLRQFKI